MSDNRQLIAREIQSAAVAFNATVLTDPKIFKTVPTPTGNPVWVVDLDGSSNRVWKNVPIKAGDSGSRFYAQRGQTVSVRRTALGQLYIVGPGDVKAGLTVTTSYSLETDNAISSQNEGFFRVFKPLEFYMGPTAMKGNPNLDIVEVSSAGTITRLDAGSFVDDGFVAGDSCIFERPGFVPITIDVSAGGVASLVLTFDQDLFNVSGVEDATLGVAGSSIWDDGLTFFPFSETVDADGNPV